MNNDLALCLEHISKIYPNKKAVDDVSLSVRKGTSLGIVGKNGCGKSTLIKLIAGIIRPTSGRLSIYGSALAITDTGAGFHPDLTGRENVAMTARLYGLNRRQVNAMLPDVEDFSELSAYMDMPVKTYSQGMFLRLAFATMVHLPLDIVLLDEALAVGDEAFREKCFDMMKQLKQRGLTILTVSHTFEEILSFCDECAVLKDGKLMALGTPEKVFDVYQDALVASDRSLHLQQNSAEEIFEYEREGFVKVLSLSIRNEARPGEPLVFSEPCRFTIVWEKLQSEGSVYFDLIIHDHLNRPVLATANYYGIDLNREPAPNHGQKGVFETTCVLPPCFLNYGKFCLFVKGSYFYNEENYFSLFGSKHPAKFRIHNDTEKSFSFNWKDSHAPVRTLMPWQEHSTATNQTM
jgi:lipopolysaccharide transport system ATP-binding protein